jgi:hypothetical protein
LTPDDPDPLQEATLEAYRAYNLPSVEALVRYFHAAAGYPVRDTWLKAIRAGNYASWPSLTLTNVTSHCPSLANTITGHMMQSRCNVQSTRWHLRPREAAGVCDQFQGAGYGSKMTKPGDDDETLPPNDGVYCLHVETVH